MVPSFLWRSFPDGSKEYLNKRWYEYTGLTLEEGKGWGWKVVVHPEDLDRLIREWLVLVDARKPGELETRIRRYDGQYRWFLIRVVPQFDAEGNVVRWFGSNTDIEDRKRAEKKLLEDEQELRRITDAIPSDFRARIFHPEDLERLRDERQAALARGLPFEIEQRARRKDGQYRWFLIRYNPFRDEQGLLVRWYATGTDIDDRKRAEDRTRNENVALREDIVRSSMFEEIVGSSEPLRRVLVQVSKVAPADSTVLVLGETGTGKELIARAIHNRSTRSSRAFIRVNCAAIPPALIASELFGHERGSFTGANQRRLGRFESADGGTIFLDEVGDLPAEAQVALLRVLQEREFERVGGSQTVSVDVRVIAATNGDLTTAVAEGKFRQDLFYRLNVFPIQLPPLRERLADISLLVGYLIDRYAQKAGKKIRNIDKKTMELFHAYDWPGNIRELQNVVERAVILSEGETFFVDEAWLTRVTPKLAARSVPLVADLAEREREMLEAALRESQGVVGGPTGAAVKLGIPRQTLESKIRKLGINRHRFKAS
jgi:formate hydrogenlyase transcriptional activator